MFRSSKLRKVLLCLGLELAAMLGAPFKPDEIEDLLRKQQQIRIESGIRKEDDSGEE